MLLCYVKLFRFKIVMLRERVLIIFELSFAVRVFSSSSHLPPRSVHIALSSSHQKGKESILEGNNIEILGSFRLLTGNNSSRLSKLP